MSEKNPYRQVVRWLTFGGNAIAGVIGVGAVLLAVILAVREFAWWTLLVIPGLAAMLVLVGLGVGLANIIGQWWTRREFAWDRKNRATR